MKIPTLLVAAALVAAPVVAFGSADAERKSVNPSLYEIVWQSMPFGTPPPPPPLPPSPVIPQGPPPPPPPSPVDRAQVQTKRICYLDNKDGLHVGIVDAKDLTWSAVLTVGETQDGFTLIEANYEEEYAILKYGSVEEKITSGGTQPAAPGQPGVMPVRPGMMPGRGSGAAAQPISRTPSAMHPGASVAAPAATPTHAMPNSPTAAYSRPSADEIAKRRKEIMERLQRKAQEQPKMTGEALEKHLENYQMDLIRNPESGPPLPVPLTKEMDDKLVAEGVLPPQ